MKKKKTIGIIGGMGPEATAGLFLKIIKATPVKKDQDHFRVIIDSNPAIPDRTAAIFGEGISPVDAMASTGKNLEKLGVDVAGIPCITAHYFIEEVQKALSFTILNALKELHKYTKTHLPSLNTIGVLATTGTVKARLFDRYLGSYTVIYPSVKYQQEKVMEAIYGEEGIKRGNTGEYPRKLLIEAGQELAERGCHALVLGCTELSLVIKREHFIIPVLDPMDILAQALVNYK